MLNKERWNRNISEKTENFEYAFKNLSKTIFRLIVRKIDSSLVIRIVRGGVFPMFEDLERKRAISWMQTMSQVAMKWLWFAKKLAEKTIFCEILPWKVRFEMTTFRIANSTNLEPAVSFGKELKVWQKCLIREYCKNEAIFWKTLLNNFHSCAIKMMNSFSIPKLGSLSTTC